MGVSIFVKAQKNPMYGYVPSADIRLLVFNLVNDMIYALFDNVCRIPRTLTFAHYLRSRGRLVVRVLVPSLIEGLQESRDYG
jgi:hypothetical protein